jgi:general secretion pathway protein D/MSHA biogenesis protein MshL
MKIHRRFAATAFALFILASCANNEKKAELPEKPLAAEEPPRTVIDPALLPSRFRQAGYLINEQTDSSSDGIASADLDRLQLKIGANIATREPITLREAMKALIRNKKMSLSWAPDVDQDLLVDIDVTANDNFYEALDNILRQLDYFHEVEGSTVVIKYRETKKYHIAMPFVRQYYDSFTGSTGGSLKNKDWENKFDQWEIIQQNLDSLIATWSATVANPQTAQEDKPADEKGKTAKDGAKKDEAEKTVVASRRVSKTTDSTYTIDKPVGLITVHAPKSLQKRVADYLSNLEKELYKQIIIEAKIIEVQLNDSSSLGINWNSLLSSLQFEGLSYGKSSYYNQDDGKENTTSSSTSYSDTTTNTNSTSSYSENSTAGQSEDTASSSSQDESTKDKTTTFATGDGKNIDNLNESTSEDKSGTTSDSTVTATSGTLDSSLLSSENVVVDALTKGTTAATFITSASGIAEGMATGVTLYGFNFTSFIKALQEQGQTSILSNPKISVLNGQPALIKVGKDITYISEVSTTANETTVTTAVKTANLLSGLGLALSAVVTDSNEIIMNLSPITAELSGDIVYETFGGNMRVGLPVVNKREMNTWVRIKDGSMLVVGGLISETDSKSGSSIIPGTQDIPYLKYLFGYEEKKNSKRELIILLRPRIIN